MRGPNRLFAWASLLVAIVLAVLFVFHVFVVPAPAKPIESLSFVQSQAVPDFEDSRHLVRDPVRIHRFDSLVKKYSIDLEHVNPALNDACTGGLATNITVAFRGGSTAALRIYDCQGSVPKGTFVTDATA
ncbi:MAG TPA: hypothetical protein VGC18_07055, partial [Lacisediminihabitans sp.]|uniref:hypothetical protein n=1 Tax=Lacisediminihabitans sp. TaxID=2787631 RepID=UPI002EDA0FB2